VLFLNAIKASEYISLKSSTIRQIRKAALESRYGSWPKSRQKVGDMSLRRYGVCESFQSFL
jgi:hypothetical protein